jgi:antitoxin ParD1/3/4
MPRNASVTLGAHHEAFIASQIKTTGYCSRSEVIRAGLTLLEEHQARVQALKNAIEVGKAGESVECSYEEFMAAMRENDGKNL